MLCIIPARGGSKGVPRKNVRLLAGLPLIAHTIGHANDSASITRVIVSTDDEEIARVAQAHGAEIPFLRPPHLADDRAAARDVYLHAINHLGGPAHVPSVVVLQPTSPLRTALDVEAAIRLFVARRADAVVSVCPPPHPIEWTLTRDTEDLLVPTFSSSAALAPRQDHEHSYVVPNGAVFIFDSYFLARSATYYGGRTYAYEMARERSIDIDDELDLVIAEALFARLAPPRSADSSTRCAG